MKKVTRILSFTDASRLLCSTAALAGLCSGLLIPAFPQVGLAQTSQSEMVQRTNVGLDFALKGCQKTSKGVRCSLIVHNASEYDRELFIAGENFLQLIDSEGNSYVARGFAISNGGNQKMLPPGVKAPLNILFMPSGNLTNQIKLLKISFSVFNTNQNGVAQFRDFAIDSRGSAAQPTQQSSSTDCRSTITATQQRLKRISDIQQVRVNLRDISKSYPDHPQGRTQSFSFAMKGKSVENVMNSPKLLTELAQPILQNCNAVSMVTFALDNSGWGMSIGWLNSGKIGRFECLEHKLRDQPRNLAWGQEYCSL